MPLVTYPPQPFPPSSGKTGDIAERVTELETDVNTLNNNLSNYELSNNTNIEAPNRVNLLESNNPLSLVNMSRSENTYTNTSSDTNTINFKVQYFNGSAPISVENISITEIGVISKEINIPINTTKIFIKHGGAVNDIGVYFSWNKTGKYKLFIDFTSIDTTEIGGLVFGNIMITLPNETPTEYIPYIPSINGRITELETDVSGLETDVDNLQTTKANQITIAPTFNAESSYIVGDLVYYNGLTYKCNTNHTGAWNAEHFTATTIANELKLSDSVVDYSTTEQATGQKWIDGKDIYFKTVVPAEELTLNSQTWTATGESGAGISTIINAFGVDSNGSYFTFNATPDVSSTGYIGFLQTRSQSITITKFVIFYTKVTV